MDTTHEYEGAASAFDQSASLLHALLAKSADMITVSDREGRIIYASPATERVSGYTVEEFMAQHPFETIHPDDRPHCEAAFAELLATPGLSLDLQHRVRHKDGSWHWVEGTFTNAFDDPTVNGLIATVRDITERKRAEAALGESEEQLQKALSIETVGVIFFDLDGAINDANQAFQRISGYSQEDFQSGRVRWDEVTPPEFMPATLRSREELLTKGENTPYEKQYIRPDGSRWWGLFAGKRLNENECVEFVLDITEQKQAEAALRESEARFRAVADLVPDLLWSNDPSGWVDWFNQRWDEYTGQTPQEALGAGWLDAIHPDDRENVRRNFQIAVDRGEPLRHEHRIRSKTGEYRWFLVHARPVRDEAGQIVRWYGTATDIHEERIALAAEQAARGEAEAALKVRDQFLSIASHELRTPLTSLIGYTHMLRRTAAQGTSNTARMTDKITQQALRLNTLIDQMLDVSRLRQGQFVIQRQPIDIGAVVALVVDEFRTTLPPDSKHAIQLSHPNEPVIVAGDVQRLEQVIVNLLSNAVKYSPMGGAVQVRVIPTDTDMHLEVEDQGIGIPTDVQARLFEPFYRANNGAPMASGFGLGLHIVREIVQRHGGRIEIKSAEGTGSIFRVVLPRFALAN